jgi:hypothetical protein
MDYSPAGIDNNLCTTDLRHREASKKTAMQNTNVKQMKASMDFRDGEISGIGKYDLGVSADATLIEQVKFFLSAYVKEYLLSGNASIEIRNGRLCVEHNIRPIKFALLLNRKLQKRYRVFNENQ